MQSVTNTTMRVSGAVLLGIAFVCMLVFRTGCELFVVWCGGAEATCSQGAAPCSGPEQDNPDESTACYLCWSNCCTFVEFSTDPVVATIVVGEAWVAPSAEGPLLTYPPLLPPPRA